MEALQEEDELEEEMTKSNVELDEVNTPQMQSTTTQQVNQLKRRKSKVDPQFGQKLRQIFKILVPAWRTKEAGLIAMHGGFLVLRTYLSVVVAQIDGEIVKHLVAGQGREFMRGLAKWFAIALPATYTNSMIRYLQSKLAIAFRTRLTNYLHELYLSDARYYHLTSTQNAAD